MSVVRKLKRCHKILLKISERPDCSEITDYTPDSIEYFSEGLSKAINRYEKEARRQKKYYRPGGV